MNEINWIGDYEFKVYYLKYLDTTDKERMKKQGFILVKQGIDYGTDTGHEVFVFARPRKFIETI